ncbi:TonB-dependent receptor [Pseudoalteromonas luteoviolacea]|uniref:TonB-dependent receptor domain-containing protein n=1 Tax=Pseudoalteromonas luteoviolacea TaxID=43657 RepID=UPI001B39747B|nr:TonB-dependent receptor [Pseudoalteromonas luteoviolacea]MBQ4811074.1 TonB-dependent receptor [Pseudoalteromonas luteoviolacea]
MFSYSKISLVFFTLGLSQVVMAEQTNQIERFEVTGSKIKNIDLESASPITTLTADDLALTGISNLEEVLQSLSASAGPAGNATNAYWTSNGYATAQVNLRGMGIKRTLVLLDGKRLVAGGTGANDSPDLNMIPMGLVERIDILKDGASAIYGADAVAGVVNIITKSNFSGAHLSAKVGQSTKKDAENTELNITLGSEFERGHVTVNVNYVDNGNALQSTRNPCPLSESDGKLNCIYSGTTIGGRARLSDGREVQFNQTPNSDGNQFEDYNNTLHGYNWFESLNSYNPMKRLNLATFIDYALSDNVQLNTSLLYANRRSDQIVTPRGFKSIDVASDFVYNPTGQDLTLKRRRNIEVPNPEFYQETDTFQGGVSLSGELNNSWIWQASYNYGRNTGTDGWRYDFDDERVAQTLNGDICSTSKDASIPCGDYFGVGELSEQVINYVTYRREGTGGNQLQSLSFDLSGDITELPAGTLAFATGAVYRKEKGWRNPDAIAMRNGEEDPISGHSNVKEAFLEVSVPLISNAAYADAIKSDIAVRYSDYAHVDAKTTYKIGLTWRVNEQLLLRGVRSSAFRTPTITEQFGGTNVENLITMDPCDGASGDILRNCLSAGVPKGFVQDGSTIRTGVGGNPEIGPETANTITFGFAYQSEAFSATLDYFDIEVDNAINSVSGSNILRLCYSDPNAYQAYCNSFTRDPSTHQITALEKRPMNASNEQVAGLDLNLNFVSTIDGINYRINWDTTRLLKHENTAFSGAETEQLLGKITSDRGSFAKWKSNLSATVALSKWQGTYSVQYIGKAEDENGSGPIGSSVPNIFYHDIQSSYAINAALKLSVGIDNLFDKRPPFLTSWNDANTDVFTYDTVGRRGYLKLDYQF